MIDQNALLNLFDSIDGWFFKHEAEALLSLSLSTFHGATTPIAVEVGSYVGKTTILLGWAAQKSGGTVFAVDPHQGIVSAPDGSTTKLAPTLAIFNANMSKAGLSNTVKAVCQKSSDVNWPGQPIRLLFIDGLHDFTNVAIDYRKFAPHVEAGGIIAFHDYNPTWPGVMRLVDEEIAAGNLIKENLVGSLIITRKPKVSNNLPFDVVVVTNPHKKPLTTDYLYGVPHVVSVTPDYPMPATFALSLTGQYRCVRGHQDALKKATKPLTLVFEDDAVPNRTDWMDVAVRATALSSRFEIVSLHSRDRKPEQWKKEHLQGVGDFLYRGKQEYLQAHGSLAYIITESAKQKFLSMPWDGSPQDVLIANKFNFCTLENSPFDHDRREGSLVDIWAGQRKLHLGCGPHRIAGWINHDKDVDLRKPLPYQDGSVDFIFTEHVVEHMTQREAWNFLEECYRVLKVGGAVRTVVPSIVKIRKDATPAYLAFLKERGWGDGTPKSAQKYIVFLHDHQSLWTVDLLSSVKFAIGFNAYETSLYDSRFAEMKNLEQHGKSIGKENNEIESISVEGVKTA